MSIGTAKSLLFGSVVRIVVTLTLSLVVVVGGAFAAGIIGIPALESIDNEFGEVTDERTEILTSLTVHNPNPIGAGAAEVSAEYTVGMNGVEMARGGGSDIRLEPGTSTETFSTRMHNERIPDWWVSHIQNGEETEVVVDATVSSGALGRSTDVTDRRTIETDLISQFDSDETRPIDANSPLTSDPILYVNSTRANWGEVDEQTTELDLRFDMYNPKSHDIPVTRLGYTIYMNGLVVGDGETTSEHLLRSKQVTTVDTTTRIQNTHLDDWWVTHLQNGEETALRIEFDARVELPVVGSTITLPLEELTYEETIETDIWGNENETESTPDAADGSSNPETNFDAGSDGSSDGTDTATPVLDRTNDGAPPVDRTLERDDASDDEQSEPPDDGGILSGLPISSATDGRFIATDRSASVRP
ncbi:LEA type 2 family protein [Halobacteria archaeon AArc-m2/3/4]|uniref:LEA type 2 family protein n=1 Tax=Natronoglomus mannanivorans TaxID=2979990 RepID=A0ABT2QJT3_9EURY|nr:LEA type 2 family protein [Halobacteria archaeon AArc-m2/3/4]